jgi:hypothetical protein
MAIASSNLGSAGLKAGVAYFILVFALGFILGFIRDIVFQVGEAEISRIVAVLVELPVMLAASWVACGFIVRRFSVPAVMGERIIMGAVAFALLMIGELSIGVLLLNRSMAAHFLTYTQLSYALGLAAQLCFAAFPQIQGLLRSRP